MFLESDIGVIHVLWQTHHGRMKMLCSGEMRCSAKLQFCGPQRCAKLEFRATFSREQHYET
ncbi:hypothetical protein U27_06129 [Candidatus Vecturithrix granuli]|uniref:Uncharacterized protein n=1 Tax=Vecturithrix granuli TaxID=1499967 RepID=A0A081C3J8_VECG1|nr:hypothetical protein U27_06129 [Candidatus Vecturithrix granuli]